MWCIPIVFSLFILFYDEYVKQTRTEHCSLVHHFRVGVMRSLVRFGEGCIILALGLFSIFRCAYPFHYSCLFSLKSFQNNTMRGSLKVNEVNDNVVFTRNVMGAVTRDIFIRGARGHCPPPLNFYNPKRSQILYVTCGTIIRRVVAAARCKSSVIDFWIFCEISGPLSHAAYTERSTIMDLLIKIPGPLNPAAY